MHLAYTQWATARLLAAARDLSPAELTRDFGSANKSVLGTLTHVFGADRVWLARLEGGAQEWPREYDLAGLAADWNAVLDRWQAWAAPLEEAQIGKAVC